jgi:hypothetical protein
MRPGGRNSHNRVFKVEPFGVAFPPACRAGTPKTAAARPQHASHCTAGRGQVANAKAKSSTPLPRSLATKSAIRRELISIYRATKSSQLPPEMTGRLVHLLSVLAGLTVVERPLTPKEREKQRRDEQVSDALNADVDRLVSGLARVPLAPRRQ